METMKLPSLPYSLSKKQLMAFYQASGMSERAIRDGINAIIAEKRKIPAGKAICERLIWHAEWKEFVEVYGPPAGYSNEFKTQ